MTRLTPGGRHRHSRDCAFFNPRTEKAAADDGIIGGRWLLIRSARTLDMVGDGRRT